MRENNMQSQHLRGQERLCVLPFVLVLFAVTLSPAHPSVDMRTDTAGSDGMSYYYLALFGILYLLALFFVITRPAASWSILTKHLSYLVLIAFIMLSFQWSAFPIHVLMKSTHYLGLLLVCTSAIVVLSGRERSMLRIFVAYTSIAIIMCIATVLIFPSRGIEPFSRRWMGLAQHPNGLGTIAMIAVWANVNYLFYATSLKERVWNIIIIMLSGLCLYGSNSMTSTVLSMILVVVVPMMMWVGRRNFRTVLIVITVVALIHIALATSLGLTDQRSQSGDVGDEFFSITGRDATFTGRVRLWNMAWSAFNQNPLLGWSFDDLMSLSLKRHLEYMQFHNGYLDLLVRGGIVGSVLLGYLIMRKYFLFVNLARVNWRLFTTLASLSTAILVHNFTEASLVRGQHLLWVLFVFVLFSLNHINLSQPRMDNPSEMVHLNA
jgi:O-antigen ligase